MFCSKCGKEISEDWKACPYCGNEINVNATDKAEKEDNPVQEEKAESHVHESEKKDDDVREVPVYKRKSFWKYFGLSIITFGIYSIYFWYKYIQDINKICKDDGKESPNYIVVMLLSLVTLGIYGWYWKYTQAERLYNAGQQYGIPIREKGSNVLIWAILGVITGMIGEFTAQYILIDNLNCVALRNREDIPNHPHLKRNAIIASVVYIILAILIPVAMFGAMLSSIGSTEEVVETSEEKPKEEVDISSLDMEEVIGKSKDDIEKLGFEYNEDNSDYENGDVSITLDDAGIVSHFIIEGSAEKAPVFRNVKLGMTYDEAIANISGEYDTVQYIRADEKFTVVNSEAKELIAVQSEYGQVDSVVYMKLTDEEVAQNQEEYKAQFIFPDSDKKYLSEDEVRAKTADEMLLGRNEIYARHGRMFDMQELTDYFSQKPWYNGTIPADQFDESVLNDFEKKNVELIKQIEDEVNVDPQEQAAINAAYNTLVGHTFVRQNAQPAIEFISDNTMCYLPGGEMEEQYLAYTITARYEDYRDGQKEWLTYITIAGVDEYYLRCFTDGTICLSGIGEFDGWYEFWQ